VYLAFLPDPICQLETHVTDAVVAAIEAAVVGVREPQSSPKMLASFVLVAATSAARRWASPKQCPSIVSFRSRQASRRLSKGLVE
jgi:hypothetical protein